MADDLFNRACSDLSSLGEGWAAPADIGTSIACARGQRGYEIHGNPSSGYTLVKNGRAIEGPVPVTVLDPKRKALKEWFAKVNGTIAAEIKAEADRIAAEAAAAEELVIEEESE